MKAFRIAVTILFISAIVTSVFGLVMSLRSCNKAVDELIVKYNQPDTTIVVHNGISDTTITIKK